MVDPLSAIARPRVRAFPHATPRMRIRHVRCPRGAGSLGRSATHMPLLLRKWYLQPRQPSLSGMWSWHLPSRCRFQVRFQFCCLRSSMEQGFPFAPGTTFWPWRFSSKDALNSRDGTPECALRAGTGVPLKWSADKSHFPRGNKWHRQIGPLLSSPLPLETARGHDDR